MKSHLKRIAAPKSWRIERKVRKWVVRANPGAHKISTSFPLAFFIRDVLGYANTMREVKNILTKKIILVDIGADGHGGVSDLRVYVNPEITWMSDEKEEWYEGCFSTDRVCGIVNNPKKIKI